jgi:hypothetical protein
MMAICASVDFPPPVLPNTVTFFIRLPSHDEPPERETKNLPWRRVLLFSQTALSPPSNMDGDNNSSGKVRGSAVHGWTFVQLALLCTHCITVICVREAWQARGNPLSS